MTILLLLIVFYVFLSISLFFIFKKVGKEGWKGLVPGLNFIVWNEIIGKETWKVVWLIVPIVNIFAFAGMAIDMVRSFGKFGFFDSVLAVVFAPVMFLLIAFDKNAKYSGPVLDKEKEYMAQIQEAREKGKARVVRKLEAQNPYRKSATREWTEAIIFAVFAAHFIRMFFIEAYTIPTSSMEGSLLVGDFLFVSKMHYGIRTPKTILAFPLLHNRLPFFNSESYLSKPNLPFTRLGSTDGIERNNPVVFNYPEGDSVYVSKKRTFSVYDARRDPYVRNFVKGIPLTVRPIDKKDHYIKRCIGLPGETLQVINKQVHINGKPIENPKNLQYEYLVEFSGSLNTSQFDEWGISQEDIREKGQNGMALILSEEQKEKIRSLDKSVKFTPIDRSERMKNPKRYFPHDPNITKGWTNDNYGPVHIPKKGETLEISTENLAFYKRIIEVYENNDLAVKNGKIFINGEEASSYTFKMNYYWMMGDNRHNSEDARIWGYVPEDHVVGKPLFIWFSTKNGSIGNGIRWNRIFSGAKKF